MAPEVEAVVALGEDIPIFERFKFPEIANPDVVPDDAVPPEPNPPPRFSDNDSVTGHIFSDDHFLRDTTYNRNLLLETTSDEDNFLGLDKYGNRWYGVTRADGTQAWARVRNGTINDGGINPKAMPWNSQTGLSSPTKQ
jgi:hypothetical protein